MHKKKRKFNRFKIIGIIGLIISIVLMLGPVMIFGLEKPFSVLIALILFLVGCIGISISVVVSSIPNTDNNRKSKEILNHFDATKD